MRTTAPPGRSSVAYARSSTSPAPAARRRPWWNRAAERQVARVGPGQPQRCVDQMHAEIDEAAAARQRAVAKPRLVGAVSVVERQVDRMRAAQPALVDLGLQGAERGGVAVGEVDAQPAVRPPRRLDDPRRLPRRPRQRLLAEDGTPGLQRRDRLLGMERGGRGEDDPVESCRQQLVQPGAADRLRRECRGGIGRLGVGIRDRGDLCRATFGQRAASGSAADPAEAEKSKPRLARLGPLQHLTQALTKPGGLSRVSFSAAPTSSSG